LSKYQNIQLDQSINIRIITYITPEEENQLFQHMYESNAKNKHIIDPSDVPTKFFITARIFPANIYFCIIHSITFKAPPAITIDVSIIFFIL
jgi:hypothetical protein